jgi:hypothetical protein
LEAVESETPATAATSDKVTLCFFVTPATGADSAGFAEAGSGGCCAWR